jgi:hypothetical protein
MKYLLDTHAFLWAAFDPAKLSPRAAEACNSGELWLSVASVWEFSHQGPNRPAFDTTAGAGFCGQATPSLVT